MPEPSFFFRTLLHSLSFKLCLIEAVVAAAAGHELVVGAGFDDGAVADD